MTNIDNILFGSEPGGDLGTGSPVDRVIGTGDSFPTFPGFVQYNKLLLNNWHNFDYFHVASIDGVDDAEIRDTRQPKPNDDGEDSYGAYYGGRSIVVNGQIRCYHVWKTDDMRDALKRAFARKNLELPLWFRLGSPQRDRLIYCKKNAKLEIPMAVPTRGVPWVSYMVPLRATDPRIHSFVRKAANNAIGNFTIFNEGNYDAKPLIRLYGPCTTMTLTRYHENEPQTIIVESIADGDYLDIDSTRVKDSLGANAYNRYSDDSDRLMLGPGPELNYFDFEGTGLGTNSRVLIQWRDAWV